MGEGDASDEPWQGLGPGPTFLTTMRFAYLAVDGSPQVGVYRSTEGPDTPMFGEPDSARAPLMAFFASRGRELLSVQVVVQTEREVALPGVLDHPPCHERRVLPFRRRKTDPPA